MNDKQLKKYEKEPWEDKSGRILRYKHIIDVYFRTNVRFAQEVHVTGQSISSLLRTGTGIAIEKVSHFLPNLSMNYLLNGIGEPLIDPDLPITVHPQKVTTYTRVREIDNECKDVYREDVAEAMREEQLQEVNDWEFAQQAAEPTAAYSSAANGNITIPISVLNTLQSQLTQKDQQLENAAAQIASLYKLIDRLK